MAGADERGKDGPREGRAQPMTEQAPPDNPGAEASGRQAPRGAAAARATGPGARPSGKGQLRREKILAAAIRHVARNGGRGTSLAQIATEAGVTQQGLLYYFPSKDELSCCTLPSISATSATLFPASLPGKGWNSSTGSWIASAGGARS